LSPDAAWLSRFCESPTTHVREGGRDHRNRYQPHLHRFIAIVQSRCFLIHDFQSTGVQRGPQSSRRKMRVIGLLQLVPGGWGWGWAWRHVAGVSDAHTELTTGAHLLDDTIYWDCCPSLIPSLCTWLRLHGGSLDVVWGETPRYSPF